jgi:hypothetical protein
MASRTTEWGIQAALDSFAPSSLPWSFYDLHIPSNVTLQGVTGSKLLQGPGGRQNISQVPGATAISNTVIAVGNNYPSSSSRTVATAAFTNCMP